MSVLLPGFDQWWENQNTQALLYSGSAIFGLGLAANAYAALENTPTSDLTSRDDRVRSYMLGNQIYMSAGSFSAYHSFRSAVRTRQPLGQFGFLKKEETTDELLLAPFRFSFVKRPTTYIPIIGVALLAGLQLSNQTNGAFENNGFNVSDAGFAGGFSYLAGTHEEALFRGYLMPVTMEAWGSEFWSNTATALIFSLAHISGDNPVPWPQFTLGWYLGYLTQKNDWTLAESIFVHTWWDVVAFTATYLDESKDPRYKTYYLPVATIPF